jgi:hypothetical protein
MKMSREWAMASRHTFTIGPIARLLEREVKTPDYWVDPFAGWNSPAYWTNDLHPDSPALSHKPALEFLMEFGEQVGPGGGVLFDPPYSSRQVAECYRGMGREVTTEDTRATFWSLCKDEIQRITKPGAKVISFGWSSVGMGKKRGFVIEEILLVSHGGQHNDTIVTVERKIK